MDFEANGRHHAKVRSSVSGGENSIGRTARLRSSSLGRTASTDSESMRDILEHISVSQAAFEDSTRLRRFSSSDNPCGHHLSETPHTTILSYSKLIICILLLIGGLGLLLLYLSRTSSERTTVFIQAKWSRYRGFKNSFQGRPVYTFLGIPFGENTSGENRFRKANLVVPSGTVDTTRQKPSCTQLPLTILHKDYKESAMTSEDCLHLNLWTPSLPSPTYNPNKTVLVFLNGCAFKWGSNGHYDATPLSSLGDIIVIVPNYRLHVLGFLGDGSDEAPGNLALYDQDLALLWVRENVKYFGGNVSSLVLHGYEAGAVSIGYHMLSPIESWAKTSRRLILQSGSPLRLYKENTDLETVMHVLGCGEWGWPCLRQLEENIFREANVYRHLDFSPRFNSKFLPYFGPAHMIQAMPIKNKEVLLGNVANEASFTVELFKLQKSHVHELIGESSIAIFLKGELVRAGVTEFDAVRALYANDSVWASDAAGGVARAIFADAFFNCPVQYWAEHLASHGSTAYRYLWTHKPSFGPWAQRIFGPTQYDDLAFVFGSPLLNGFSHTDEEELSRRTIEMFSGFAKTGVLPRVNETQWPAYSKVDPVTVDIGLRDLTLKPAYRTSECSQLRKYLTRK
ncbi:acetylcholinesterase-1-like [Ornithodoros turicata]|uniref:acetylcholinesterase-1-like n=1 Tax=Ornithodoros turicata TaxID=34597 RepID=UPI00313A0AE4